MPREVEAKIKEIIQRAYNVKSVRLEGAGERGDFRAGQFMRVTLEAEKECKRYLSISSSPTENGHVEFTKKITRSDFSAALDALKPGDRLKAQYPMGKFTLEDNLKAMRLKIAFLSGGIGITPIRSICKYAADKDLGTDIALIYANRSFKDIVFREDFEQMQRDCRLLKVSHVLSEPEPGFKSAAGHINSSIIMEEIRDYKERKFFLCGPPAMVEAMQKILSEELAVAKDNIVTENFVGYE